MIYHMPWCYGAATEPLGRLGPPVVARKHVKAGITLAQSQNPATGMLDHSSCLEHHLVHERPDATASDALVHWGVGLVERELPNHAQKVPRHICKLAHQVVCVKLARGQALQIHVGLELRMELLMGDMIAVQGNDVGHAELLWKRGGPAFNLVVRKQQGIALLVYGALNKTIDPSGRVAGTAHLGQVQAFLPDALLLAGAQRLPLHCRICRLLSSNRFNGRTTWISLDEDRNLAIELKGLSCGLLHQLQGAKTRVRPKQQSPCHQSCSHREGALKVVFALVGRMLHPWAQCKILAVTHAAQRHRKWAVAVNSFIGATHLGTQGEPVRGVGNQTLAQGRTQRNRLQVQGAGEEGVGANVLDCIEVFHAQAQQAKVRFQDVAVGHTRAQGESGIDQGIDFDGIEILADKCQTGMGTQVVGELFDNDFGHTAIHLLGNRHFTPKPLIYDVNSELLSMKSRIQEINNTYGGNE